MKMTTTGKTRILTRRAVLRQAAAASAVTAFGRRLLPAHAAGAIPTRLLLFYTQHGITWSKWKPSRTGGGEPTETDFDLNTAPILQPLAGFKDNMILISGILMRSWCNGYLGNGHQSGQCHSLTDTPQATDVLAGGPSIDQYIVQQQKTANGGNPLTSISNLTLTAGPYYNSTFFSASRAPVAAEKSPKAAFDRVFPGGKAPGAGTAPAPDLSRLFVRRRRSLALASGEMRAIGARLGTEDRQRLEAHATLLDDLQKRIVMPPSSGGGLSCAAPTNIGTAGDWTKTLDDFLRVSHGAFACDVTRVIGLNVDSPPGDMYGYTAGLYGVPTIHEMAHQVDTGLGNKDPNKVAIKTGFDKVYAERFATLLDMLRKTPEADGKTMLDHTLVLWCGEIGTGNHVNVNLKWILAGNADGYFKSGRYLNFGPFDRFEYIGQGQKYSYPSVPSHGNLFISMAQAMGLANVNTFGVSTGPIAQLRG